MEVLGLPLGMIGPFQIILVLIVTIFLVLFPILAIIDIVRNDFKGNDKLIWVLVTLLLPFLGPILYFIIGRKARLKS
jgi:hypothetical protein